MAASSPSCGLPFSVSYEGTPPWEIALSFAFLAALVLGIIFVFVGPFLAVIYEVMASKGTLRAYRAAAGHVGLAQPIERRFLGSFYAIEGLAGAFRVSISRYGRRHGQYERRTQVTVAGKGQIPPDLNLRAEGLGPQIDKALGDREIAIGDAGFDSEVYARGPEDVLRALCDTPTRSLVRALASMDGVVTGGSVRVTTRKAPQNVEPVTAVLETAIDTARHLVRPEDIVRRIVELVRTDPEIGVREQCLMYLARAHREHPAVQALLREALTMPNPELRVRAAIALGSEGRETLLELVRSADVSAECVSDGIRALGELLPEALGIEILEEALRPSRRPVAQAAIIALGLCGTIAAIAPLRAVVEAQAFDRALRHEAEAAIARIQARLRGAEAGHVSIPASAADAGQLSLAKGSGQLSLDKPGSAHSPTRRTEKES